MKILKWGVKKKKLAKFVCEHCECKFLAEDEEYKYEFCHWDDEFWYSITCPCCKKLIRVKKLNIETIIEEIKEPSSHRY